MESTLKQLDALFNLLKLCKIDEPPELAAARAAIEELMAASGAYAAAVAEVVADVQRRVEAMQVHCPVPVLPAPDPAVARAVEAAQQRIAESLQPKWDEKYNWEKAAIN